VQRIFLATEKFNDSESNRVWTSGGASCEDAVRAVVDGRSAEQLEPLGAIKHPQDDQMRETFDVGEAGCELREDFENSFGFVLGAWTFRDFMRVLVGSSRVSDGLWGKHEAWSVSQSICAPDERVHVAEGNAHPLLARQPSAMAMRSSQEPTYRHSSAQSVFVDHTIGNAL